MPGTHGYARYLDWPQGMLIGVPEHHFPWQIVVLHCDWSPPEDGQFHVA